MLAELPLEILCHVAHHLSSAQDLAQLRLTCRSMRNFVDHIGWHTFVRDKFPSTPIHGSDRDAVHGLTTLSRNWDRRAFVARLLEPQGFITSLPAGTISSQWNRPSNRQSMGYVPLIDSYETWNGAGWADRRQVLAFSAGSQLELRVKHLGHAPAREWEDADDEVRSKQFDPHRHKQHWVTYRPASVQDGPDDITSINLLRPDQELRYPNSAGKENVVIGRANGSLSLLGVDFANLDMQALLTKGASCSEATQFETAGRAICSSDVSPSSEPLLAACLGHRDLGVYSLNTLAARVEPSMSTDVLALDAVVPHETARIWATRFLSSSLLAAGLGPSSCPLVVYDVASGDISTPLRRFETNIRTSVFPITASHESSHASSNPSQVFYTGTFNGIVRAHDMRSPAPFVSRFEDTHSDYSAVYSLAHVGPTGLAAGFASHNVLKLFDIRSPGVGSYNYLSACPTEARAVDANPRVPGTGDTVFVRPDEQYISSSSSRHRFELPRSSPVYSLSSPSPSSPYLFAGIEGGVTQIELTSLTEPYPDPIYKYCVPPPLSPFPAVIEEFKATHAHIQRTWSTTATLTNLSMYIQTVARPAGARSQSGDQNLKLSQDGSQGQDGLQGSSGTVERGTQTVPERPTVGHLLKQQIIRTQMMSSLPAEILPGLDGRWLENTERERTWAPRPPALDPERRREVGRAMLRTRRARRRNNEAGQ